MVDDTNLDETEAFAVADEPKSARGVLAALKKAEDAFREWQTTCQVIDDIYNRDGPVWSDLNDAGWNDAEMDLFWSSFEVLKPAVYARAPQPVVAPLFKDGKPLNNLTAELLERCAISTFQRTDIDGVMVQLRDDLLFSGRGAPWVRYEHEGAEHNVCVEHKDRLDFLHEPARKWAEVGWVAGAAWMTRADMRKRFERTSGTAYQDATFSVDRDADNRDLEKRAQARKAKVWEVHHKADGRVYWVTDGVGVLLDGQPPEFKLTGFFPCPKPAYATLRRRSLIPVPDWARYAVHFKKISELTRRIYSLLDKVRMKGLIPAGGDVGDAIEELIQDDSDQILIPVPGGAMMQQGANGFVAWMPLNDLSEAITGLIAARTQLINDFYQLSGISDIMRGATDADETLGAQQLKSQYGSVRVREKSTELQRVAADTVKIAAEIIAQKFPAQAMLDMSGLTIPKAAEIKKHVAEIEHTAQKELEALSQKAQQAAQKAQKAQKAQQAATQPAAPPQPGQPPQAPQGPQAPDPDQAQQMMQQAQQAIMSKYAPLLQQAEEQVAIEDVMKLLRDDRTRSFVFEIESSSTIMTDELAEKQSRNEFMQQFTNAQQGLQGLVSLGEPGAKLAGSLMKFVLAPYRAGRDLDGAIDEFIDAAPAMAQAAAAAASKGGDNDAMAAANDKLAQAEQVKAQAALQGVQAKAQNDQAAMQARMTEMQGKAQESQQKLQIQLQSAQDAQASTTAKVNLMEAQTATLLHAMGLDEKKQQLDEYTAANAAQSKNVDQALEADRTAADLHLRHRSEDRADQTAAHAMAQPAEEEPE
ncbi:MAG: hypothetical protein ACRYGI_11435 [Janthinobacterium lividum]